MSQQPLWTTEALARAMGGSLVGKPAATVSDLSIDTRTLEPGEAYVAIKGHAHDGHAFAHRTSDKRREFQQIDQERDIAIDGDSVEGVGGKWLGRRRVSHGPMLS